MESSVFDVDNENATSFIVDSHYLKAGRDYIVYVQGVNEEGPGAKSYPAEFETHGGEIYHFDVFP